MTPYKQTARDGKPSNKQVVNVLKAAIPWLAQTPDDLWGYEQFICCAIQRGARVNRYGYAAAYVIDEIIMARLEGHETLACWLTGKLGYEPKFDDIQQHRVAWVKLLIEEFSV
jgi:hypothetical protein